MRKNRIIWAILWILSLGCISSFGGPVSYGFFAMMTLIPFVALIYLLFVISFFRIYQKKEGAEAVVNQPVKFYFTLVNEYHFAFSSIRVNLFSSFSEISGLDDANEYELLPQTEVTKHTRLMCRYRGYYPVGIKSIEAQDFFRLFKITYKNPETLKIEVLPALVELTEMKNLNQSLRNRTTQHNPTEPDVLVRKYVQGDDARQINWPLSAKAGELLVRKRIGEEQPGISIVMSTERISDEEKVYIPVENKLIESALAIALYMAKKGITVDYYQCGSALKATRIGHMNQFQNFYREISRVDFYQDNQDDIMYSTLCEDGRIFNCKAVFLIISRWSQEAEGFVALLAEHNIDTQIYLVNDEDEAEIPVKGVEIIHITSEDKLTEVM